MNTSVRGYWTMTWLGLVGNVLAMPLIAWFAFFTPAPCGMCALTSGINFWADFWRDFCDFHSWQIFHYLN